MVHPHLLNVGSDSGDCWKQMPFAGSFANAVSQPGKKTSHLPSALQPSPMGQHPVSHSAPAHLHLYLPLLPNILQSAFSSQHTSQVSTGIPPVSTQDTQRFVPSIPSSHVYPAQQSQAWSLFGPQSLFAGMHPSAHSGSSQQ